MILATLLLATLAAADASSIDVSSIDVSSIDVSSIGAGAIRGVVRNASQYGEPIGQTEVVLRVRQDGRLLTLASTTTDAAGRFAFEPLPIEPNVEYLPGANRGGVHYPGPRVRLDRRAPVAEVTLNARDCIAAPNPLVIRRHEIVMEPRPGATHVTESLVIANPTVRSYVGRTTGTDDAEPITLRLNIPSDFVRVTFDKEFFGRRFSLADGTLVTTIPWTPGERELAFTYVLADTRSDRTWRRPLDLPCDNVRVCVRTTRPNEVTCNLPQVSTRREGNATELVYRSAERTLPAGHVLRVGLEDLPVAWMVHGRWMAVATLLVLVASTAVAMARQRSGKIPIRSDRSPGARR